MAGTPERRVSDAKGLYDETKALAKKYDVKIVVAEQAQRIGMINVIGPEEIPDVIFIDYADLVRMWRGTE